MPMTGRRRRGRALPVAGRATAAAAAAMRDRSREVVADAARRLRLREKRFLRRGFFLLRVGTRARHVVSACSRANGKATLALRPGIITKSKSGRERRGRNWAAVGARRLVSPDYRRPTAIARPAIQRCRAYKYRLPAAVDDVIIASGALMLNPGARHWAAQTFIFRLRYVARRQSHFATASR